MNMLEFSSPREASAPADASWLGNVINACGMAHDVDHFVDGVRYDVGEGGSSRLQEPAYRNHEEWPGCLQGACVQGCAVCRGRSLSLCSAQSFPEAKKPAQPWLEQCMPKPW